MLSQADKTFFMWRCAPKNILWTVLLDTASCCVLVKGGYSKSTWLLHLLRGRPSAQNMCLEISTFLWVRNITVSEALSFYRRFSTPMMSVSTAFSWICWWVVYKQHFKSLCFKTFDNLSWSHCVILNNFWANSICLIWDNQMANWMEITIKKIALVTEWWLMENFFKGPWKSPTTRLVLSCEIQGKLFCSWHLLMECARFQIFLIGS